MLVECWTCLHCLLYSSVLLKFPGMDFKALDFCVSEVAGVRISGISGSDGMGTMGLAFTIAVTYAISVVRTS